ncbi:MAG: RecQ family ATP-dependent DNA helicase [Gemmatimonadetes bacterium]|nr:RecQ family ATP-dependent DNA helicase [Gemmatimonadota bacterium]MYB66885.1 RecQ family ATP-dependent DNA helicase [Gemmatimonadota bacterium]
MDSNLSSRCLSLDLEVGKQDHRIHAFAAVRPDVDQPLVFHDGDLATALVELDDFADGADFLLGHNLIDFDLPHLEAAKPDLRLLKLPAVDTLRLNPLAFPRNPYHHLVKHYQDGQLKRGRLNDPELDARIALEVFDNQQTALRDAPHGLLEAWHWLTGTGSDGEGFDAVFADIRDVPRPTDAAASAAIRERLAGIACQNRGWDVLKNAAQSGWPLAYALAWLSVSGGNSVMPPWVRHQFPAAGELVRQLRDMTCGEANCDWCRERHDARKELKRWFGFDDFRLEPVDEDGRPMQRVIVEAAMAGEHILGILPTGTGKSLCYQIPALSRYDKTGALTVVISPLVALMADQVAGLRKQNIDCCVTINGLLSMPERAEALDQVHLGDAGILIISPEQLRSTTVRRALGQREIGAWVLDEAHCLSKWGHDFRPDYRYVGRFIREKAGQNPIPPVLCLTATAKPDVVADIKQHFRDELDAGLKVFDGGARRDNLDFTVVPTTREEKFSYIHQLLIDDLSLETSGGAIVYCATQRQTQEVAEFLQNKEIAADYFHADVPPETKKNVQQRFIDGELRVIAATNAFGMGIDKPDVRLVIHADIPGSLENYMQEAGRAGRDREMARCVLLYATDDVERQFGLSARSRLTRREIHGVLRALRNLDRKKRMGGEVVATAGEILGEDEEKVFERDSATDDTRVRTAVSWLEEAVLLTREENRVQVFPSSLRVDSVKEAHSRLAKASMPDDYRRRLLRIAETLIGADPDEGISTDELMGASGLSAEGVRSALYDLEQLGIASNDTALTAFVHAGVERNSRKRFDEAAELETALIAQMREAAPDMGKGQTWPLHLRVAAQTLRDAGVTDPLPEKLKRIVGSIARDGRGEGGDAGSLGVRQRDTETVQVTLRREWSALEELASRRREGAKRLLEHLLACLPSGSRGTDLLAETTLGKLLEAITSDLFLKSRNPEKLLDRALLWLHEQEVIRLNKGLAVFRPAMTILLAEERRGFASADFAPLDLHYKGQVRQIHVMAEFAERGRDDMADALHLAIDYFSLKEEDFLGRWLPERDQEIVRETTPESWRTIVESLKNPIQQRIVADDREQTNVLVLAGPGSGKTRVLVHRIAYLVRVKRENPRGILALAYNRHAAVEIRRRLVDLIGNDARGVTVLTCHALAMRLVGVSFQERERKLLDDGAFREVLRQAVALLRGEGLEPEEADDQRERLLAGFRWILVDEYQDIGADQYELISALAGRTLKDEDRKLTLFAVGDDDQNIYAFNGASVEFIRRFEVDYGPKPSYLIDNYRSTGHIIAAANELIEPARQRMKTGHPISIDRARTKNPPGGDWSGLDSVAQGRVQILPASPDPISQAQVAMTELQRLATLSPDWDWSKCAVIAREWKYLEPVRAFCELHRIPVQMGNEEIPSFWFLRETRTFVEWLRGRETRIVSSADLRGWLDAQTPGLWNDLLGQALDEHSLETSDAEMPVDHFIEWLAEWGRDVRRRQRGLLLLTAHRAKGLEFDHVAVLDGGWNKVARGEDPDAPRRLYYVAMTRAQQTLALVRFQGLSPAVGTTRPDFVKEPEPPAYLGRSHSLPYTFPNNGSILRRTSDGLQPEISELARQYRRPSLSEVYLGFAGRLYANHPVHRAIAALSPGDQLKTRIAKTGSWELLDRSGMVVGRLAQAFAPPPGMRCRSATVFAVVAWSREASEPQYRDRAKCDAWEVVVPELVFEPEGE